MAEVFRVVVLIVVVLTVVVLMARWRLDKHHGQFSAQNFLGILNLIFWLIMFSLLLTGDSDNVFAHEAVNIINANESLPI